MQISRRAFLKQTLFTGAFLGSGTLTYASGYERHDLDVTRVSLALGLPRPLRAALVSDIHFDPHYELEYLDRAFLRVAAERPDIVLHTGDFASKTTARFDELGGILGKLNPPLGSFAALGNHDHWAGKRQVRKALARAGIHVLLNAATPLPGQPGWFLTGLESFWAGRPDRALFSCFPREARFLSLVHEPDAWDELRDPRIRLQLSGHTHGGQVRAPFLGALHLPKMGKHYSAGLYRRPGGSCLYVNRGIGTTGLRVRFNCRPEITILDLT